MHAILASTDLMHVDKFDCISTKGDNRIPEIWSARGTEVAAAASFKLRPAPNV